MTQLVETAPPRTARWWALTLTCVAQFMVIADISVVNVALPTIAGDLSMRHADLTWIVSAYSICFGGLMILGGRLSDVVGRRRVFLSGLALFTAASAVSGLAPTGGVLIAGRAAQGVGAALMSPAALSLVTTTFTGPDRQRALGIWSAIGGAGAAVGVLLGGVLTSYASWRWVFFVNVPIGVAIAALLPRLVPATRPERQRHGIDLPGAVTITAATALLVFGLVRAGAVGWGATSTGVAFGLGVAAAVAFVLIERGGAAPLVPPALLRQRPVVTGVAMMLAGTALLLAGFFLSSLYLQQVRHFSPVHTGLIFLPVALAIGAGVHSGSRMVRGAGPRLAAVTGFAVAAVGAAVLSQLNADSGALTHLLPGFLVLGAGAGILLVAATTTALAGVGHSVAGVVSGIVNSGHELGAALGVAAVTAVGGASISGPAAGNDWPVGGFDTAFGLCVIVATAAAVLSFWLVAPGKAAPAVRVH